MYMWTRIGGGQADVYGSGKEYVGAAAAWQLVNVTQNSKELDAKTSNLARRCNRKFNKANTEKIMQGSDWFGWDELTLIFFGFFMDYRYGEQTRSKLRKTVKSHRATWKSDTT